MEQWRDAKHREAQTAENCQHEENPPAQQLKENPAFIIITSAPQQTRFQDPHFVTPETNVTHILNARGTRRKTACCSLYVKRYATYGLWCAVIN